MSKSASGTLEEPGKMVAAKSDLNRSILGQGWYSFKSMLSYKLDHLGGELLLVDPRYTSQKCSNCGYAEKENRLSRAQFACVRRGHKETESYYGKIPKNHWSPRRAVFFAVIVFGYAA